MSGSALHASMLSTAAVCMQRFHYQYILGERVPPAAALVIGSTVHDVREVDLIAKRDQGVALALDEVSDLAATKWEERIAKEEMGVEYGEDENEGASKDMAIRLSEMHSRFFTPKLEPVHVERTLRVEVPGLNSDFEGTLDTLTADGVIHDCKTAKKRPSADELSGSIQAQMYSYLVEAVDKVKPRGFAVDVLLKTKKPAAEIISAGAVKSYEPLLQRAVTVERMVHAGLFPPADPRSWACSERWCGYWSKCPFGKRGRISVAMNSGEDEG